MGYMLIIYNKQITITFFKPMKKVVDLDKKFCKTNLASKLELELTHKN